MRSLIIAFILIISATTAAFSADTPAASFAGDWSGALEVGQKLRLVIHLVNTAGAWSGTMDSPDQGANGIPFSAVTVDGTKLHIEVKSIGGGYDGTLGADGKTITGTWTQSGMNLPLNLGRGTDTVPGPNRPQEPKPPFPYRSDDVTLPGPGGITLAGTFTAPNGNGPFPTVLLITGSGPQDRNEALMGHKPFLVLSDYLTRQGIAVLRLDDRGVGKSTGRFATATTEDFAQDALAAVAYLKTRKEVDAKKIGLVGHSEGGVIAPIVASRSKDVAYIVMMAGVGVSPQDLLVKQASDIMRASGLPETAIQYNTAAQRRAFQIATSAADSTLMRQQLDAVADSLIAQLTALDPSRTEMVTQQVRGGMALTMTPWYRYFLTLKPAETLRKVKQPVLAINGSLDLQVSAKDNLPVIEKALKDGGNKDVTATELPGLNHLFQTAKTGSPVEYAQIEETMSPVALKTIGDWIVARTSPKTK
jgi:pimeloyl-ACP methyl ester carboxylesterase